MTFPLTDYICGLYATDRMKLARADPDKMARKFGIRPDWAREYLQVRLMVGGV